MCVAHRCTSLCFSPLHILLLAAMVKDTGREALGDGKAMNHWTRKVEDAALAQEAPGHAVDGQNEVMLC